ncbi:hypothetical protein LOZ66_000143 [Ophidiomyces ophidiicola]|nr:hypothetical protein LOZ66_000143 [Ophidiomyces ophidiicola]
MAGALPRGLVSNTDCVSSDLQAPGTVEIEDVAKLWRVYTTTKVTLKRGAGRRLENLFWRIWSNGRISSTITGSTLATLFTQISDESPLWTRDREELGSILRDSSPKLPPTPGLHSPSSPSKDGSATHMSRLYSERGCQTSLPPSILKKPSRSSPSTQTPRKSSKVVFTPGESSDDGKILKPYPPRPCVRRKVKRNLTPQAQPTVRSERTIRVSNPSSMQYPENIPKANLSINRTPHFHSHVFENRPSNAPSIIQIPEELSPKTTNLSRPSRPVLLSDQSTPPQKHTSTPLYDNPPAANKPENTVPPEHQPAPKANTQQQSQAPPNPAEPIPEAQPASTTPLVDKDFRARFVEKPQHEARVSSLTSLISSDESFSLSISPAPTYPLLIPGSTNGTDTSTASRPDTYSSELPEALLSRTLSAAAQIPVSRGGSLRLPVRQRQESYLARLIEEERLRE